MPNYYPGYQKVEDPEIVTKFERAWGVSLPRTKGLDNHQMVDAIHEGKLKAIYLAGEDMFTSDSNAGYVGDALGKLELFVVQELFFTKTCQLCGYHFAGVGESRKRWHIHKHREAHPASLQGF